MVSDLQDGVVVGTNGITAGELNYVEGYTDFSEVEAEQEGNYIALHYSVAEDVDATFEVLGPQHIIIGTTDNIAVARITDKSSQIFTVVANAPGYSSTIKNLTLNGLTLDEKEDGEG